MKIFLPQIVLNGLSLVFNIVPRFVMVGFSEGVTFLWFYVIRFRKKLVLDNMRQALGSELSESEIQKLAYKNFRHYVYFGVEYVQLTYMSARRFNKQMILKNTEIFLKALQQGRGVIILGCHQGHFEWTSGIISHALHPLHVIARAMKNKGVHAWLSKQRTRWGTKEILPDRINWTLFRLLKAGELIAFLIDQHKSPPDGIYVDFFGRKAATTKGLAYLVERTSAIVVPILVHRQAFGTNVAEFQSPLDYKRVGDRMENIYHNTQIYSSVTESLIRNYPDQWFWIHKRWKGSPPSEKRISH